MIKYSKIYSGQVIHTRFKPKKHQFKYKVFSLLIDLDEIIEINNINIIIDNSAVLFLLGTELDYEETKLNSGFVFNNPNEKGRCGCGESFHV